jgi:hypothetical protein
MQVVQAEPTTLERFQRALGMGLLHGPYHHASQNGHTTYYYSINKQNDVQTAMLALWPYLSEPKRAQMEGAIDQYRGWSQRF